IPGGRHPHPCGGDRFEQCGRRAVAAHGYRHLCPHYRRNRADPHRSDAGRALRVLPATGGENRGVCTGPAGTRDSGTALPHEGGNLMLMALQAYYLFVSGALFLYALSSPRHAVRSVVLGMAMNIFPLALQPYMNMDVARLAGMPLVYLPVTAAGLALATHNGLRFPRSHRSLYILILIYLVYTFCNTMLARGMTASNLVYWLAWPLNFLIFIGTAAVAG